MGRAVAVYGAVAVLIVASAGPVLAGVRDASLADIAALDEPRTLNDFPFLRSVEPYLPPIVVDWLIIRPDRDLDLPDGAGYRLDPGGRVIIVWPDGCEETQEQFRSGSRCADAQPPDCDVDPLPEPCRVVVDPPDCLPGEIPQGAECVRDPECEPGENRTLGAHCPLPDDDPVDPGCPLGETPTTDGGCIALQPHRLDRVFLEGTTSASRTRSVALVAPYENLSLEIAFAGIPAPQWSVKLFHADGTNVCWVLASNPEQHACTITQPGALQTGSRTYLDDGAPLPAGDLTLLVEYEPGAGTGKSLEVRLFGKPADHDDAS